MNEFEKEWQNYFKDKGDVATINIKELAKHFVKWALSHPTSDEHRSTDERIRQSIIADVNSRLKCCTHTMDDYYRQQIAWLEKQGEQKPIDYENATIIQKDFAPKKGGEE